MSFLSIIYSVAEKDAVRARGLYREKFILSLFCKKRMWESPSFAAVPGNRTERPTLKRETIMKPLLRRPEDILCDARTFLARSLSQTTEMFVQVLVSSRSLSNWIFCVLKVDRMHG